LFKTGRGLAVSDEKGCGDDRGMRQMGGERGRIKGERDRGRRYGGSVKWRR
jgi:hypothetical protein